MKLEIKYLAPYLPYGLKVKNSFTGIMKMGCWSNHSPIKSGNQCHIQGVLSGSSRPIFRPLSDLTKQIEYNEDIFYPYDKLKIPLDLALNMDIKNINNFPYKVIKQMIEWHFDVFGLIEKGLAIDINSIENRS